MSGRVNALQAEMMTRTGIDGAYGVLWMYCARPHIAVLLRERCDGAAGCGGSWRADAAWPSHIRVACPAVVAAGTATRRRCAGAGATRRPSRSSSSTSCASIAWSRRNDASSRYRADTGGSGEGRVCWGTPGERWAVRGFREAMRFPAGRLGHWSQLTARRPAQGSIALQSMQAAKAALLRKQAALDRMQRVSADLACAGWAGRSMRPCTRAYPPSPSPA